MAAVDVVLLQVKASVVAFAGPGRSERTPPPQIVSASDARAHPEWCCHRARNSDGPFARVDNALTVEIRLFPQQQACAGFSIKADNEHSLLHWLLAQQISLRGGDPLLPVGEQIPD